MLIMTKNQAWILVAFIVYLAVMLLIGFLYFKRTKNTEDYFLGGRKLNGWVAALSAQASDMSGWLLMGLPGAIYAAGTGQIWIAVGLAIGTLLNWTLVASRLRRYTLRAGNSLTLPSYFENRFRDKTKILRIASSLFIMIFFLVYTASGFAAGANLFASVFDIEYSVALTIGVVVILAYTFLGGFMAVCVTDFIQGLMMLIALMVVPVMAFALIGGSGNLTDLLAKSNVNVPAFLNPMQDNSGNISAISIISQLGWALGYFGMPHILVRFMAIRSQNEVKKSRVVAMVWVALSLGAACMVGVIGRAYLMPTLLEGEQTQNVFIQMILKMFTGQYALPFVGGIFLCGILAAVMSTADSQLLVTASSISEDIFRGVFAKNAKDKTVLLISRITVVVVAIIAYIIAWNPKSSVMGLVSNAWAGFGAAFGPVIILSLFWRRGNYKGAIAGMLVGGLTVILWDYIPLVNGSTLGTVTGLYSLVIGFALGLVAMIVVSLLTGQPEEAILKEYDEVRSNKVMEMEEAAPTK